MSRTDYHIQNDPELGYLQAQRKFIQSRGAETALTSNPLASVELVKDEELKDELKYDTAEKVDLEEVEEKTEAVSPKQEEEKMETENGAEVKSEESQNIPQVIKEKVTESEDMPTLPVPVGKDSNKEEQENLMGTENHKPNTEKNSEEEEEKMDEDDKSEKSSQAEGKRYRCLTASDVSNLFIQIYSFNSHFTRVGLEV